MITTKNLSKRYGEILAVDDVSFSVNPGEVLGFLGANGAGKSTTMRMIAGFIAPSAGTVSVCGHDIERSPVQAKSCMGYLPEGAPSYGEMTVGEFLDFVADIRGLGGARRRERRASWSSVSALAPVIEQVVETLSKGFRRRVGLAQALIHDPQVLILDEPTDGLDPNQKHEVRRLINELSKDKLVIVSTHILEEVHEVCTRAIIIADGRIVADETPAALEARSRYHHAVSLRFDKPEELAAARRGIAGLPEVTEVETDERELKLTAVPRPGKNVLPAVSALITRYDWDVPELHLESGRLDEVFRTLTGAGPRRGRVARAGRALMKGERGFEQDPGDFPARAPKLFRDTARVRVHRDFPRARGRVHVSGGRTVRARPGRSAAVLPLAPLALPGAHPRDLDAPVGGGAQQRQHRASDDAAGHVVRRRWSVNFSPPGASPALRWRSPSRSGSR